MRTELIEQAAVCRQKAAECERQALLVGDKQLRKTYEELATTWLEMSRQVELLAHHRSQLSRADTRWAANR